MAKHLRETQKWGRGRAREPAWERHCYLNGAEILSMLTEGERRQSLTCCGYETSPRALVLKARFPVLLPLELIGLGGCQPRQWTYLMNSELNGLLGGRSNEGTWSIEPRSAPISCSQIPCSPLFPWCSLLHIMLLLPCCSDAPLVTVRKPSNHGLKLWTHEPRQTLPLVDLFPSSILSQWGGADWHISRGHPSKWRVMSLQFYGRSVLMD